MTTNKPTQFLIYRHGSNRANQSLCERMPVGVISARTRQEALENFVTEYPDVSVYANQYLSAVREADASVTDWNALAEEQDN